MYLTALNLNGGDRTDINYKEQEKYQLRFAYNISYDNPCHIGQKVETVDSIYFSRDFKPFFLFYFERK